MENIDLLIEELNRKNITLDEDKINKIENFVNLLQKWNNAYNLVGKSTLNQIYTRHILDSVQLLSFIDESSNNTKKILDFGSGAGIPSIVLAILMDNKHIYSCERIGKKCQFLNQCRRELGLNNFTVIQGDVRDVDLNVDVITCRAVATLKDIFHLTSHIRDDKTVYVLPKGINYNEELKELDHLKEAIYANIHDSIVEEGSVIVEILPKNVL